MRASDPFDALGDPTRRQILRLLSEGDKPVHEIAAGLPISRPAVSRHLRLLKGAGMVAERAEGNRRIYHLEDGGLRAVQEYLERVWGEAAARFRLLAENTCTAPLRITFDLDCAPQHAFRVWTQKIGTWWPRDHTVSGDPAEVVLESGRGGRIYERTAAGERHEWGEVTLWEPPRRLAYLRHLGRDRAAATEVAVHFADQAGGAGTRVEIEHSGWDRLGDDAGTWRERNRAGWGGLLPHFAAAVEEGSCLMASGTKEDPWVLKTPPGSSEYTMYRDEGADPPVLVCQVGSTKLTYDLRAIEDLHAWLRPQGDWVPLGSADENKEAAVGTVEAWGRSADNPVGGWYGLRKGYRGRFGMYLPPLLEELGLAELTHDARNNKMRAL